jgi:protoporphyrinogen oxidase
MVIHIVRKYDLVVLGGGWSGLLVAKKAIESGTKNLAILESADAGSEGGLLKSEMIDGFTFDCGGPHLLL